MQLVFKGNLEKKADPDKWMSTTKDALKIKREKQNPANTQTHLSSVS